MSLFSVRMRASAKGRHISGAEGLFQARDAGAAARDFANRALRHSRGIPDQVVVTLDMMEEEPESVRSLPVFTLENDSPQTAKKIIRELLKQAGLGDGAFRAAWQHVTRPEALRGAVLLDTEGIRLDPELERGIRVSRLGISKRARIHLERVLADLGPDMATVREALVLASKVHAHPQVLAEVCVSDDPDYTTGYVACRALGYVRIPRIKKAGSDRGGRVFFVAGADAQPLIDYLERRPVMVTSIAPYEGIVTPESIREWIRQSPPT